MKAHSQMSNKFIHLYANPKEKYGLQHDSKPNIVIPPTVDGLWQASCTANIVQFFLTTGYNLSDCYLSKFKGAKSAGISALLGIFKSQTSLCPSSTGTSVEGVLWAKSTGFLGLYLCCFPLASRIT